MKRFIACLLTFSLAVLAPGTQAYAAAGPIVRGIPGRSGAPVRLNLNLPNTGVTPALTTVPTLQITPTIKPGVQINPTVNVVAGAQVNPLAKTAQTAETGLSGLVNPMAALETVAAKIAELPAAGQVQQDDGGAASTILGETFDGIAAKVKAAESGDVKAEFANSKSKGAQLQKSQKKGTPDSDDEVEGGEKTGPLDGNGNPTRRQTPSDDDRNGGEPTRDGNSTIFGAVGFGAATLAAGLTGNIVNAVIMMAVLIPSLILHEMGHAKAADVLGDKTAKLEGRLSFTPRGLMTHIDPIFTLVMPFLLLVTSGMMFGGARPVPVNSWNFKKPITDMAKVAFAGPAVNFALAVLGGAAFMALGPTGLLGALMLVFVQMNIFLGLFNLIPLAPLDGSHILRAVLPAKASATLDGIYNKLGGMQWIVLIAAVMLIGPFLAKITAILTLLVTGGAGMGGAFSMASAYLPAVAALGMVLGQSFGGPKKLGTIESAGNGARSDVIVIFEGAQRNLARDIHLSDVNTSAPNGVEAYASQLEALRLEVGAAGLESEVLDQYNVTPIASYRRINAATLQVDAARAEEFKQLLRSRGFRVYDNARRQIVKPIVVNPESLDPEARGAITMEENLKLTNGDFLIEAGKKLWGDPEMGAFRRFLRVFTRATAPQPLIGVIDTGADVAHPLLKGRASTDGADDNGHGTWVTSMILNYAPWLKKLTMYKAFTNGGATLDDILKALTKAGNAGNIIISNSWGDDEGDPNSPDAELVAKLGDEGHIMVFARGNAGPGKDTLGGPANRQNKRVLSIGSRDKLKKMSFYTSRGKQSPKTKQTPGSYADGPANGVSGPGQNTEGAWPTTQGDQDRVDPKKGPVKDISGTSMITPAIAGGIAVLAMLFGVTQKGAALDLIVQAVLDTRVKDAASDGPDDGYVDWKAAYQKLVPSKATILQYRAQQARITSTYSFIARATQDGAWGPQFPIEAAHKELSEAEGIIKGIEAQYPRMDYWGAGFMGRSWLRLTGKAVNQIFDGPPEDVIARWRYLQEQKRSVWQSIELSDVYEQFQPLAKEHGRIMDKIAAIEEQYPRMDYWGAGPVGRWWLRVTGRGPGAR